MDAMVYFLKITPATLKVKSKIDTKIVFLDKNAMNA